MDKPTSCIQANESCHWWKRNDLKIWDGNKPETPCTQKYISKHVYINSPKWYQKISSAISVTMLNTNVI